MHMLFEMKNQEFEVQGRKYQMLPNFGICCAARSYEFLRMRAQFLLCGINSDSKAVLHKKDGARRTVFYGQPWSLIDQEKV